MNYVSALKAAKRCEARKSLDMALDFYSSALSTLPDDKSHGRMRLEILQRMSELQQDTGRTDEALETFNAILSLPDDLLPARLAASAYEKIGVLLTTQGKFSEANAVLEKGLECAAGMFPVIEARLLARIARAQMHLLNKERALGYCERVMQLPLEDASPEDLGAIKNNLGVVYGETGRYEKALDAYQAALEMFRQVGDQHGVASVYNNMAYCHWREGRQLKSIELLEEGYSLTKKTASASLLGPSAYNLGGLCAEVAQYRKAFDYLKQALDYLTRIGASPTVRNCYYRLGNLYKQLGKPVEAEAHYVKAMELCDAEKDKDARYLHSEMSAVIDFMHGLGSKAIERLDSAILHSREANDNEQLCFILMRKASFCTTIGRWSETVEVADEVTRLASKHNRRVFQAHGVAAKAIARANMSEASDDERLALLENALGALRDVVLPEWFWRLNYKIGEIYLRRGDVKEASAHIRRAVDVLERIMLRVPEEFLPTYRKDPDMVLLRKLQLQLESKLEADKKPNPAARLLEATKSVNAQLSSNRLFEVAIERAVQLVNAQRGFLLLIEKNKMHVKATCGGASPGENESQIGLIEFIAREVAQTGRALLTADAGQDHRLSLFTNIHNPGLLSVLCVPLSARGEITGVLYVDNRFRRGAFTGEHLDTLNAFADQVALAIENALLYRENLAQQKKLSRLTKKLQAKLRNHEKKIEELERSTHPGATRNGFAGMVGESQPMQKVYAMIRRVADIAVPVLIQGESGTGKELVARAIHSTGNRRNKPFVAENCAALPEPLLESELFGYIKGAFTGADRDKKGLFELANGGTLMLDEVGDMSPGMQAKLLRVLQEGRFRPVGGKELVQVNVRLVTASNKNLAELVKERLFREDLLYRLNAITITVVPLRERREDIPLLVKAFAEEIAARDERRPVTFEPDAMRRILMYDWPGNIRELRNFIEKIIVVSSGATITESHVEENLGLARPMMSGSGSLAELPFKSAKDIFVRNYIRAALERSAGNVSKAARASELDRRYVQRLIKKFGLANDRNPSSHN